MRKWDDFYPKSHIENQPAMCYRIGTEEIPFKTVSQGLQQINWANRRCRQQVLAKAGFPPFLPIT
jgi:hypothetical protein